jgi:redox-sensitive bicupin YhaK (pirin superfamily)
MEIVTYVIEGSLEHRDSMGTGSVLRPGDVQRMSAGRGVTHSEFNHSKDEALRLLQIWILPEAAGIEPEYEERHFGDEEKRGRLRLLTSPGGEEGSLRIHQDARIYASMLSEGDSLRHEIENGRHAWIQIVSGDLDVNGIALGHGDGAAVSEEAVLEIAAKSEVEFLLFDLA